MTFQAQVEPERPLWLIHRLGLGRYFWARWSEGQAFLNGCSPLAYATSELPEARLREQLQQETPTGVELELEPALKAQIYRRIRRAELPLEVRDQIAQALQLQRQQRQHAYAELGFEPAHLHDLASLRQRFCVLAYGCHPDYGGDPEHFQALQRAYQAARLRLQASSSKMR